MPTPTSKMCWWCQNVHTWDYAAVYFFKEFCLLGEYMYITDGDNYRLALALFCKFPEILFRSLFTLISHLSVQHLQHHRFTVHFTCPLQTESQHSTVLRYFRPEPAYSNTGLTSQMFRTFSDLSFSYRFLVLALFVIMSMSCSTLKPASCQLLNAC